jgi:hypothetical protein
MYFCPTFFMQNMNSNKAHFFDFVKNLSSEDAQLIENEVILFELKSTAFYFQESKIEKSQYFFKELIQHYSEKEIRLIVIYEFQWIQYEAILKSRIESFFGKSDTIHGRKTKFVRIDKAKSEIFLNQNHLQGYVSSKFKYGLILTAGIQEQSELVAVATFSAGRKKKEMPENLRSFELIRFANKSGFRVIGGLSKLLNGFVQNHNVGDIMTYIDAAWSDGSGFIKLGFEKKSGLEPFKITENSIYNAGSLKLVLDCEKFKVDKLQTENHKPI